MATQEWTLERLEAVGGTGKPSPYAPVSLPQSSAVRRFSIADARQRVEERVETLPLLGRDGYFVRGWTHLVAGWWRLGKTETLAAIVLPWLRLGERVLWITEEPDSVWADRAEEADEIYAPTPWERLTLVDALSADAPALLEDAATDTGWTILVADTIREVCGIASMKNDDEVVGAVTPWLRRLRDGNRTLIFLAQHRKMEGELGSRIAGTHALPAKFDIVMELDSVKDRDHLRKLSVRRRRESVPPITLSMDEEQRITVLPDGRSRTRVSLEQATVDAVAASPTPLTTAAVRTLLADLKPSRATLKRALYSLAEAGRIVRDPPLDQPAERLTVQWSGGQKIAPNGAKSGSPNLAHPVSSIDTLFIEPDGLSQPHLEAHDEPAPAAVALAPDGASEADIPW